MSRDWTLYLDDITEACSRIATYTDGMTLDVFVQDTRTYDAVIRNLEVIGIAVSHLPQEAMDVAAEIPWRRIKDMRNLLTHAYFGVDDEIVWDVIRNHIPALQQAAQVIRNWSLPTEPPT